MNTKLLLQNIISTFSLKNLFLWRHKESSHITQQKAYVLLWTYIIFIGLISLAIISHIIFPRNNSATMHIINLSIITVTIFTLLLLKYTGNDLN